MLGASKVIYIPDDAAEPAGAGNTGTSVPPSALGPVGKDKLIIVDDIYSELGTAKHRLSGDYALGQGGAEDVFRDFLGKVWTQTAGGADNPQKLEFLNPKMGAGSSDSAMNLPCDVYVDSPKLAYDQGWPEYSQTVFIDPDPYWLFNNIGKAAFADVEEDSSSYPE